jgi:dTDP-D-glucose 4,6-dehydratase
MTLLVTGGCGFIGSNFIRHRLASSSDAIVNLDALTYAGNPANLQEIEGNPRYRFSRGRIEDPAAVKDALAGADAVVHFAAESHVDRSIADAAPFITTNVLGTQVLLDAARHAGSSVSSTSRPTRSTARWARKASSPRRRPCGRARPTPRPRLRAICLRRRTGKRTSCP